MCEDELAVERPPHQVDEDVADGADGTGLGGLNHQVAGKCVTEDLHGHLAPAVEGGHLLGIHVPDDVVNGVAGDPDDASTAGEVLVWPVVHAAGDPGLDPHAVSLVLEEREDLGVEEALGEEGPVALLLLSDRCVGAHRQVLS